MANPGYELTVVIPTLNERGNVRGLAARLDRALEGVAWEAVFVDDDSADGTADEVRALSREDPRIRLLHRIGRRGLASACVEGMLSSHAPLVAVVDADGQHDESLLPRLLAAVREGDLDIAIGSRFVAGGDASGLGGRVWLSRLGARLSRRVLKADLRDPMSGFFLLRSEFLHTVVHDLSQRGFKILLDIFLSSPRPVRFAEVPYRFGVRQWGTSKLDTLVAAEFLYLLADKVLGRWVPVRFVVFVLVGGFGVLVHLTVLGLLHRIFDLAFLPAQVAATVTAMVGNFTLNNLVTFRDRRLTGAAWWRGLASFAAACSVGALVNFLLARFLFDLGMHWAGAGLLGAAVGAVWNYAVTITFTWRTPKPPA